MSIEVRLKKLQDELNDLVKELSKKNTDNSDTYHRFVAYDKVNKQGSITEFEDIKRLVYVKNIHVSKPWDGDTIPSLSTLSGEIISLRGIHSEGELFPVRLSGDATYIKSVASPTKQKNSTTELKHLSTYYSVNAIKLTIISKEEYDSIIDMCETANNFMYHRIAGMDCPEFKEMPLINGEVMELLKGLIQNLRENYGAKYKLPGNLVARLLNLTGGFTLRYFSSKKVADLFRNKERIATFKVDSEDYWDTVSLDSIIYDINICPEERCAFIYPIDQIYTKALYEYPQYVHFIQED